jgi:hypothetical protein
MLGCPWAFILPADLPIMSETSTAAFADDTAVPASGKLQTNLTAIPNWLQKIENKSE